MSEQIVVTRPERRITGLAGLVGGVASIGMVGLYFVYAGPPPLSNVLARNLITVVTLTLFGVFAVGLDRVLKAHRRGDSGLAGGVAVASLGAYVVATLVSASIETGTSLWYPDGSLDPTVDGPLSAAAVLLHGPIARVLVATYLIALAAASRGVFALGIRIGSAVLAVINLALVPSVFFGMNAAFGYAANGWGSVALIGAVNLAWFAVLGGAVLATGRRPR